MDRKEFLGILGISAAAAACGYCFGGCKVNNSTPITGPTGVDFTWDLTNPSYSALKTVGNYLYNSVGVIIAHTPAGYVALSSACTHQGNTVVYDVGGNNFFCPAHGSRFAADGSVINGPAASPLTRYNAVLTGNSLHVYS